MKRIEIAAAVALWVILVGGGMVWLTRYSLAPGRAAAAPALWPERSAARRHPGQPTLVMIAHPRCACTRASLAELSTLMARCQGRVAATVVFVRPAGTEAGWEDTDLKRTASAIPGVEVLTDAGGSEAGRFGAWTSGQVLLYDAAGRLQFHGGITAGRGHAGDNPGRAALEARLLTGAVERSTTPVFGCELFDPWRPRERKVVPSWQN
jgi:hypothetical protein